MFERLLKTIKAIYNKIDIHSGNPRRSRVQYSVLWTLIVLVCFSILLFLNVLTPLISDDITYLYIYGETTRISSVSDVIQSQVNHYYMWGGRSVVHFIAQILLLLPSYMADILNAAMYMLYIYLIYWHVKGKGANSISLFILINLAVWFLQPVYGDTILWITGSANYLWGTAFILLFLLPYRLYEGTDISLFKNVLATAGILLWGLIAGWTNENTAGAMILMVILFFFYYRSRGWKIPLWAVSGLVGSIVGFAVMILAPGNFERAGEASSLSLYILAYRLFNYTFTFFYYAGPAILAGGIMFVLYHHFAKKKEDVKGTMKLASIYYIASVAAVYAMLLSPTFPRRALFGVVTYLILGMGMLYYNLDSKTSFIKQMRLVVVSVGLICFGFTLYLATKEINAYRSIVDERTHIIKEAKKEGLKSFEFERFDGGTYIHGEDPYSAKALSLYYDFEIKLGSPKD